MKTQISFSELIELIIFRENKYDTLIAEIDNLKVVKNNYIFTDGFNKRLNPGIHRILQRYLDIGENINATITDNCIIANNISLTFMTSKR